MRSKGIETWKLLEKIMYVFSPAQNMLITVLDFLRGDCEPERKL